MADPHWYQQRKLPERFRTFFNFRGTLGIISYYETPILMKIYDMGLKFYDNNYVLIFFLEISLGRKRKSTVSYTHSESIKQGVLGL